MTLLFLETIAPWLLGPAKGLAHHVPVTALQHVSFGMAGKLGLDDVAASAGFSSRTQSFPPGFSGRLTPFFAPFIRADLNRTFSQLQETNGLEPHVIAPFPYCEPWVRDIPDGQLVYYNVDDYAHYRWPNKRQVRSREDALITRAHLTICVSIHQAQAFRRRHPQHAGKIHHLPHGLAEGMLNPAPESPPEEKRVGYVGNLSDRVDWDFVDAVVQMAPDLEFEFVGTARHSDEAWAAMRARVFARDNVRHVGPVPQEKVASHYWKSAVNWMPYDLQHPFNPGSSPTKIFDAFGAGRPFVSTDLPEVSCHPERILVARCPEEAAIMLRDAANSHDPARARELRDFASGHVWHRRAEDILDLLGRSTEET